MEHADVDIPLDVVHGVLPDALRLSMPRQEIPLPVHHLRGGQPACFRQIEHRGKRPSGELGSHHPGDQARLADFPAQLLQLREIGRNSPSMLLHQRLVIVNAIYGVSGGQEVDPAVHRDLIQDRGGKIVDKIISG